MAINYLLDTDICINIIRSRESSVLRKIHSLEIDQISISALSVAELETGVAKSSQPNKNALALAQFLSFMQVLPFDQKAAHRYGTLRASLEAAGNKIGAMDMLIAAQALAEQLVLVTNNYREFKRVKGLSTESWFEVDLESGQVKVP